jgi:acyl phosphate:glycerol-3-phosphate acyltransferase
MDYILSALIGYFAGSIPFGYIVLRKTRGLDITETGSGNMGAMNTYEISNSRTLGILVLLLDALKGLAAVYIPLLIFPGNFIFPALGLLFAVLSHCYNPWLEFKGGRGLATAAGGSILIFPYILIVWVVLWVVVYFMRKDIHLANISSTILTLLVVFNTANIAYKYSFPEPDAESTMIMMTASILILILIKHFEPLKELIKSKTFTRKRNAEKI